MGLLDYLESKGSGSQATQEAQIQNVTDTIQDAAELSTGQTYEEVAPTAAETFERETGIDPNDSIMDEVTAAVTGFGRGASFGIVSQDDNNIVQSAQQISPGITATGEAVGTVASTISAMKTPVGLAASPARLEATLGTGKLASNIISRGIIGGASSGVRGGVDVLKGKQTAKDALFNSGIAALSSSLSVAPELIPMNKINQLWAQPLAGVLVDFGVRRMTNDYPDDDYKKSEGSLTSFIETYGTGILLDLGFAIMDVRGNTFTADSQQMRRELGSLLRMNPNYKLVKDPSAYVMKNQAEIDRIYDEVAAETNSDPRKVYDDVVKEQDNFNRYKKTYGKSNKMDEALKSSEQLFKQRADAVKKTEDAIETGRQDALEKTEEVVQERVDDVTDTEALDYDPEFDLKGIDFGGYTREDISPEYLAEVKQKHSDTDISGLSGRLRRKDIDQREKVAMKMVIEEYRATRQAEKDKVKSEKQRTKQRDKAVKELDAANKETSKVVDLITKIKTPKSIDVQINKYQKKADNASTLEAKTRYDNIVTRLQEHKNSLDIPVGKPKVSKVEPEVKQPVIEEATPIKQDKGPTKQEINNLISRVDDAREFRNTDVMQRALLELRDKGYSYNPKKKELTRLTTDVKEVVNDVKVEDNINKYVSEINELLGTKLSVKYGKLEDGKVAVYVDRVESPIEIDAEYLKTAKPEDIVRTMNHEIGHAIVKDAIELNRDSSTKLEYEYARIEEDIEENYDTMTVRDYIEKYSTPERLTREEANNSDKLDMTIEEVADADTEYYDYITSKDEWAADNVAKWLETDSRPVSAIDRVFKAIADSIKKMFASSSKKANKAISDILNGIVDGKIAADTDRVYTGKIFDLSKKRRRIFQRRRRKVRAEDQRQKSLPVPVDEAAKAETYSKAKESMVTTDDLDNLIDNVDPVFKKRFERLIKLVQSKSTDGAITVDNNKAFMDNISTVLKYVDDAKLSPKMGALKVASDNLVRTISTEMNKGIGKNFKSMLDKIEADSVFKGRQYAAENLASAYISNRYDFQTKYPELFDVVDDYVMYNTNNVKDDFSTFHKENMTEASDEATVKQTDEMRESVDTGKTQDTEETKGYNDVMDEAKNAFETVDKFTAGELSTQKKLTDSAFIQKTIQLYDSAFGFRYIAGKMSKALRNSGDAASADVIRKGEEAEMSVRESDFTEAGSDAYMKEFKGKVMDNLEPGEEDNFKVFLMANFLKNDPFLPDDYTLPVGKVTMDKAMASKWLDDIKPELREKYDTLRKDYFQIRKDWIFSSLKDKGQFTDAQINALVGNEHYIRIKTEDVTGDHEHSYNFDSIANATRGIKSRDYVTGGMITDPLTATVKHDMALLLHASNNKKKADVVGYFAAMKALDSKEVLDNGMTVQDYMDKFITELEPTKKSKRAMERAAEEGGFAEPEYAEPADLGDKFAVEFYDNGFKRKFLVSKEIEDVFDQKEVQDLFNTVGQNIVTRSLKSMYTAKQLGFIAYNFLSDAIGTSIRLSPKALLGYPKAMLQAWDSMFPKTVTGKYKPIGDTYRELTRNNALFASGNFRNMGKSVPELRKFLKKEKHSKLNMINNFKLALGYIDDINMVVERTAKFAGYNYLKNKGYEPRAAAAITRDKAGSPNFAISGTKMRTINNLFMFANPALRGWAQLGESVKSGSNLQRSMIMMLLGAKIGMDVWSRITQDGLTDEEIARGGLTVPVGASYDSSGNKLKDYAFKMPIDKSVSDLGGLLSLGIMQVIKSADERPGTKGNPTRMLNYVEELVPSLTPVIALTHDMWEYASEGNIKNSFGYNVLTKDEEHMSFMDNKGKIAKHFMQGLGIPAIIGKNSVDYITGSNKNRLRRKILEKKESSVDNIFTEYAAMMHKMGGIPIAGSLAGRFSKSSNYGEVEIYNNIINEQKGIEAQERVEVKRAVERILLGEENPEDWATVIRFPDNRLSSAIAGIDNSSALGSALSRVPDYDKETQAKIIMDYIERRE